MTAPDQPPDVVDPLDLLIVLGRYRRMLLFWPLVASVIAAGVSLMLPLAYTATTRLLPPQRGQSNAAAMLSQLGGLAEAAGGAVGIKNPGDLYVSLLKSDTVADALIEKYGLKAHYALQLGVDTRQALAGNSRIMADKSGIIVIEVDAREPALAANLANAYVEQLHRLTSSLAVTEAAQRRVFFGQQLQQAKQKLAEAEVRLRQAIEKGGLVSVDAQSRAAVETVARLRAQISAKDIQIGAMRAYATTDHPEMRRAEQELSSMRLELARLEGSSEAGSRPGGSGPKEGGPGVGNIGLVREVKYDEVMFELLAKQYELARVEEGKEAPLVQVVDPAVPPERRSRPKRTQLVLFSAAGAFLAAIVAAFVRDAVERAVSDPLRQGKISDLRSAWRARRPAM